ncbi:BgTH12-07343 [Blumeria graminis f. sp. triticale]|uniref:BgTH12-07343 n=1 Tax=Blumeria graminis f. sp. triticale TaxID=1689686 RepID=A0A9W4DDI2_BLUGR|nr:BgTH12-07343 [Blumeria graminis f. sp. triticale]
MTHAWLDSLSEDWPSQIDSSGTPASLSPSTKESSTNSSQTKSCRILEQKYETQAFKDQVTIKTSPVKNKVITCSPQGSIRKSECPILLRDRSKSPTLSTQHNTVQHKISSVNPRNKTPEWKQRIVDGKIAYGEQRDLFTKAGLENLFQASSHQNYSKGVTGKNNTGKIIPSTSSSSPAYSVQEIRPNNNGCKDMLANENKVSQMWKQYSRQELSITKSDLKMSDKEVSEYGMEPIHATRINPNKMRDHKLISEKSNLGARRIFSGHSDSRNECLSQIHLSNWQEENGKNNFSACSSPLEETQQKVIPHRESAPLECEKQTKNSDYTNNTIDRKMEEFQNAQPENFSTCFISNEPFQKQVQNISRATLNDTTLLTEESMQASTPKQLPKVYKFSGVEEEVLEKKTSNIPKTPRKDLHKSTGEQLNGISKSPLKIFGTHDTFTTHKLLSRLNQLESGSDIRKPNEKTSFTTSRGACRDRLHLHVNESYQEETGDRTPSHLSISRKLSNFGFGDLDACRFTREIYHKSNDTNNSSKSKGSTNNCTKAHNESNKTYPKTLDGRDCLDTKVGDKLVSVSSTEAYSYRGTQTLVNCSSGFLESVPISPRQEILNTPRKNNGDTEGKRLPKTPLMDPEPKRRRTFHKIESSCEIREGEGILHEHSREIQQIQLLHSKKRKDARHEDDQRVANSEVLAIRQVLKPKLPGPGKRNSQTSTQEAPQGNNTILSKDTAGDKKYQHNEDLTKNRSRTPPSLSNISGSANERTHSELRKRSITSLDFIDEAHRLMVNLRAIARTRSVQNTTTISNSEYLHNDTGISTTEDGYNYSYQDSTQDPFSRPPSREGTALVSRPNCQQDPNILEHLHKYRDNCDSNAIFASLRSISKEDYPLDADNQRIFPALLRQGNLTGSFEHDLSNPKNLENHEILSHKCFPYKPSEVSAMIEDGFPSQRSNASSGKSTVFSEQTGCSRGSDSCRVIAPKSVCHLIPTEVAGMKFDQKKNTWFRKNDGRSENSNLDHKFSEEIEDDPLRDISDLSVDVNEELRSINIITKPPEITPEEGKVKSEEKLYRTKSLNELKLSNCHEMAPQISTKSRLLSKTSRVSGRFHNTALNLPNQESREASTHIVQSNSSKNLSIFTSPMPNTNLRRERTTEIEKDRYTHDSHQQTGTPIRRNITISFSSPIESHTTTKKERDLTTKNKHENRTPTQQFDNRTKPSPIKSVLNENSNCYGSYTSIENSARNVSRRFQEKNHERLKYQISRIDEQDEDIYSADKESKQKSISIFVANAAPSNQLSEVFHITPRPSREIGTLTLTPLSDFTVHHANESFGLDVSYIAQARNFKISGGKRTLSLSIKELVEKLTEVEPYEPFWEDLKHMNLRNKRLTTVHKLDEFCEKLEELDASCNRLNHLNGIPRTVRKLHIAENCISDMTAWGHLTNLQYVDVSNNELKSLSSLKSLVHLRGIRADKNKISDLKGVSELDGLLNLRLRDNNLRSLDFQNTKLQSLTNLDVRGNQISEIQNIQKLESITVLDLNDNHISHFTRSTSKPLSSLKYLRLSGNNLESIDVSQYPNLRLLYLDRNRLGRVTGLLRTRYLDSISIREQRDSNIDSSFVSEVFEVRKIFLSGNLLCKFKPQVDFLNLQYLELANCGLETLPEDFGALLANVRVLNLNFNALRDIQPIKGILRLKKLHLAGNRLIGVDGIADLFLRFPALSLVDLRCNPLTVGFYSPILEGRMAPHDVINGEEAENQEPYTLAKADSIKDNMYKSCLDMRTRMKRRIYEMFLISSAHRLRYLDGLLVDKTSIFMQDKVYHSMVEAGFISSINPDDACPEINHEDSSKNERALLPKEEEIWPAEDSFG